MLTKLSMMIQLLRWKKSWARRDLDLAPPVKGNPKFMTARQAARLVPDGAVVVSTGMAGTMRASILYWAIRDVFQKEGHPGKLTWIAAGGAGGRGKIPGTVEECGLDGLITRMISAHLETLKSVLALADKGRCEVAVLPQGTMVHLIEAQGRGEDSIVTDVGVGTFVDPRVGTGSQVLPGIGDVLVVPEGDNLRYRLPTITAAVMLATAADVEGNVYMIDAPMLTEVREGVLAAKKNGGVALVTVASIVPKDESRIFLRADEVDAIVVNPSNEMTLSVLQSKPWREFVPGHPVDFDKSMKRMKAFNDILKLDPARGPVEDALARACATQFTRVARPGCHVCIGYGLPQEVGRLVRAGGLSKDVKFLIETGVYGGIPAPGCFFGMGIAPERLMSSAEMFHLCRKQLDVTLLGILQADAEGNVNVSRKAPGVIAYIGPGGFMDLVTSAKNIVFVGSWMARADMVIEGGKLNIRKPGIPKFVAKVDEVTFSGRAALAAGKNVSYVTNVGCFRLTTRGLELFAVAPGVDPQRDIIDACPDARIVMPLDGKLETWDAGIMTGAGFGLRWESTAGDDVPAAFA
jgi:propionate CoA-transferase